LKVTLRGTRGSIASAGSGTTRYGGDTSSVDVALEGRLIVLDAGSGIRTRGPELDGVTQVDILLSHLHMDHIQGLPFFAPLLQPEVRVDVWGPVSYGQTLQERLNRYLSPPLFPVRLRDLPNVSFHDVAPGVVDIDGISVTADLVSHPGPTLGYRLEAPDGVLAYLPDHEPALGARDFPGAADWTSGYSLARGVDLLIHDSQYTDDEYAARVGWGHSSLTHLLGFVGLAAPKTLVTFHHDPSHTDDMLDVTHEWLRDGADGFAVVAGMPGVTFEL
jgi:phosphoribosyl 1,2-cyclic phosphodiesterase